MSGTTAATWVAIASAIAATGTGVYEGVNASNISSADQAAQKQQLQQQQQAQANQANLTKREAVLGAQGQEQQQTGGSLTDSGTAALTDLLAGYPGYQAGTSTGTGVGSSGVAAANSGTPGGAGAPGSGSGSGSDSSNPIAAILAALRGGSGGGDGGLGSGSSGNNISGGNWQFPPAQPQARQELANPPLG